MKNFIFIIGTIALIVLINSCKGKSSTDTVSYQKESSKEHSLKENDTILISGILICTHCYALNINNIGIDHDLPKSGFVKNCAKLCAEQNYPIGILSEIKQFDSNVWVIRTSAQMFADYMSNEAKIKGLYIKDALVEPIHIDVKEGNQWISLQ